MRTGPIFGPSLLAILTGLLVTAFVGYSLVRERDVALEVASLETENFARVLEEHTRQSLRRINTGIVEANAALLESRDAGIRDPAKIAERLRGLLPPDRIIRSFLVLDRTGTIVLSTQAIEAGRAGSRSDRDYFIPVSYTHLDVYKRQAQWFALWSDRCLASRAPCRQAERLARGIGCLLYTSRCV